MRTLNIFTSYEQKENNFTNGLISLLNISKFDPQQQQFEISFLRELLHSVPRKE
jgi:hypothetical protein